MARVAVVTPRASVADALVRALRAAPHTELCEPIAGDPGHLQSTAFDRFDTLVYAPGPANGRTIGPDVEAVRAFSERIASVPFKQTVVVSSAAVYAPSHQNVGLLDESAFIPAGRSDISDAWQAVEEIARQIGERSGTRAPDRAVLRPAAVLDGSDYFSRLFTSRVAITYPGHDPTIQVLSVRDLAGAVAAVVDGGAAGAFNVAPAGAVPLKKALQVAGVPRLPLARIPQNAVRSLTATAGLSAPGDQLKFIQYSWTVSGEKLRRTLGFTPSASSTQAIAELCGRNGTLASRQFDEFGMDPEYIDRYCGHLFHFLHDHYWRVEIDGLHHVPRQGRGVLVGVHRGFMPFDGVMALYALVRRVGRIPRFLIHPSLTKFPFLGDFMAKLGGVMACQENGDLVLQRDELLGVFPEGIRGAFSMYSRAYTLGKFGRDEYVRFALRNRAPLLPFVTVGSAEIYPILGRVDWSWFKRYTEWPFFPITAAPFPLPSKWHTRFLAPMHIEKEFPPEAADDPRTVRTISLECRQRMQAAIDDMLLRRRSIFFGSIFNGSPAAVREPRDSQP